MPSRPTLAGVRELAAQDFERLNGAGYVERHLPARDAKRWRHAIAGRAHGQGWRVDTGYVAGVAWAVLVREPVEPGRALRP